MIRGVVRNRYGKRYVSHMWEANPGRPGRLITACGAMEAFEADVTPNSEKRLCLHHQCQRAATRDISAK